MLRLPTWQKALVLIVMVLGVLFAFPNLPLPANVRAKISGWLPSDQINLGLDLRGGSYLLLEVDLPQVQKDKAESMMGDIRAALVKAKIAATDYQSKADAVSVRITDMPRYAEAKTLIDEINPSLTSSMAQHQYDVSEPGNGVIVLRQTEAFATQTRQQILEQSVQVVSKRIDQMGTREATVVKQGDDRIVVEVPGLQDPQELIKMIGKTAKMTFKLVDENADPNAKIPPIGDQILPDIERGGPGPYPNMVLHRRDILTGERVVDASQGFNPQTGAPVVDFRLDSVGARQFGQVTTDNNGHLFAIILDNQVISAPKINGAILGGSAFIEGAFTVKSANDLAILLRAGALPAKLNVIEQRTVGAELGADSIKAGRISIIAGLALVALFMVLRYGLFGLFADLALTLNLVLLLAAITAIHATLTLPGIAGIVLTMGMAVDANVLVFERIREEQRGGRGILASIDTGFNRAMATIFDANATHLIAALVLFELASGTVRGFAVALALGIITSFFTSMTVTRLIVVTWLNVARPRKLVI